MSKQVDTRTGGRLEGRRSRGLRPLHTLAVVGVAVVGVLVAFWALSSIAGFVWGIVKLAVIVGVVAGVVWLFMRRRHR